MSRPLSAPPRLETDGSYEVIIPDDPTLAQEYLLPIVGPYFSSAVNSLSPSFATAIEYAAPIVADHPPESLFDPLDRHFGPGSIAYDYAQWVADVGESLYDRFTSPVPLVVPDPPLVGIETNPGPKDGMSRAAARRLRRLATQRRALSLPVPPPPQRPRQRVAARVPPALPASVAAAYSTGISTSKPVIIRSGDDSTRIRHSELLTLVNGTVNFSATSFSMQPGLQSSFPWLSTQTVGWEKYQFHSLRATYYTRTGTSTPGSMILAPDYDPADSAPASEQQATSFHGAADDAPWKTITVNFDMKRSRELFLRGGPLAANLDIKTYDFANLYVCTADGTAVNWGKIFLEYDVSLINPQILSAGYVGGSVRSNGTTGVTRPFGDNALVTPGSIVASVSPGPTYQIVNLQNLIVGQEYDTTFNAGGTGLTNAVISADNGITLNVTMVDDLVNAAGTSVAEVTKWTATARTAGIRVNVTGTTCTGAFMLIAPVNTTF
jgi:hypothetical protein